MNIADFDYELPPGLIAQTPIEPRDASRLLVVHRDTGRIEHRAFRDIGAYLRPGDLLVANRSRVLPARLRGVKAPSGGRVELLLLAARGDVGPDCWEALVRPGRRIRDGQRLAFGDGRLTAEVLAGTPSGGRIVRLATREGGVAEAVAAIGTVPLPPYIRAPLADPARYQTVYAREPGSAAAPTAGLHFTPELLARLEAQGVGLAFVTLHIGLDTFRPVAEERLEEHAMHSEEIELDAATAARINATRAAGGRIVAVGTTSVRVLESAARDGDETTEDTEDTEKTRRTLSEEPRRGRVDDTAAASPSPSLPSSSAASAASAVNPSGVVAPFRGRTALFIRPGYRFRAVDAMITNFHLPRSTLIVLVSAFAGRELTLRAYAEAVREGYRFYSFGDAMLIL